jgi:hypothetical protein
MQKSGNKEVIHPPIQSEHNEFHKAGLRTKISSYLLTKSDIAAGEVKLPTKEELERSIDSLFIFSESKQPGKRLNSAAGIADATSLYIMAFKHPVAVLGLVASEGISFLKNYLDNREDSGFAKSERKFLEKYKSDIISTLESKLPIAGNKRQETELKSLINETESFFSAVEVKSKEHLDSALKRRLQGIGSFVGALIADAIIFPVVDYTVELFQGIARVQPFQPPGYNPDSAMALIDLGVRAVWLLGTSALILTIAYDLRKDEASKPLQKRNDARDELKDRADKLLERIHEIID